MNKPFQILEIPETSTLNEIKIRYRELMKIHHPDHGGDGAKFIEYNIAYKKALEIALSTKCKECNGSGKIEHRKGFSIVYLQCPECRGSGLLYR